jgi:hypothetical protein
MATPAADAHNGRGLNAAAHEVADHASAIARLELELATLELRDKALSLALGTGLGAGAALCALFAVAFLLAAVAAGLALVMPWWAALLVTAGILLAITAALALLARSRIRKATPPVPEAAIQEAKLTTRALKR